MENPTANNNDTAIKTSQGLTVEEIAEKRNLIPISFLLVIIFFFTTFCTVSCGGEKLTTLSGIDFVTGKTVSKTGMSGGLMGGSSKSERMPPNIFAILAFGSAFVGLGMYIIKEKRENIAGTVAGLVGTLCLLILYIGISNKISSEGQGYLSVSFNFGYWISLLGFIVAGVVSYFRIKYIGQTVESGTDLTIWARQNKLAVQIISIIIIGFLLGIITGSLYLMLLVAVVITILAWRIKANKD